MAIIVATTASSTAEARLRRLRAAPGPSTDVHDRRRERDRGAGHLDRLERERAAAGGDPRSVSSATARVPRGRRNRAAPERRSCRRHGRRRPGCLRRGRPDGDRRRDRGIEPDAERAARNPPGEVARTSTDCCWPAESVRYAGSKSRRTGVALDRDERSRRPTWPPVRRRGLRLACGGTCCFGEGVAASPEDVRGALPGARLMPGIGVGCGCGCGLRAACAACLGRRAGPAAARRDPGPAAESPRAACLVRDVRVCPDVDRPQVFLGDVRNPDDVRRQRQNEIGRLAVGLHLGEDPADDGMSPMNGIVSSAFDLSAVEAGEEVRLRRPSGGYSRKSSASR
jgi:hypothetical protein